jgi:hypothetical protein
VLKVVRERHRRNGDLINLITFLFKESRLSKQSVCGVWPSFLTSIVTSYRKPETTGNKLGLRAYVGLCSGPHILIRLAKILF